MEDEGETGMDHRWRETLKPAWGGGRGTSEPLSVSLCSCLLLSVMPASFTYAHMCTNTHTQVHTGAETIKNRANDHSKSQPSSAV